MTLTPLLLDEDCPTALAAALGKALPGVDVIRLPDWHRGAFLGQPDPVILAQLAMEGRALVSFDVNTLPRWWKERFEAGEPCPPVILIDHRTFRRDQPGAVARALVSLLSREPRPDGPRFLTRGG